MRRESLLVAVYILAVAATTAISGALGPLASVLDSLPGIGLVIVIRGLLQDHWKVHTWFWMGVLILMGTLASLSVNATHPRVALASGTAFVFANITAGLLYPRNRRLSIVAFAVVDSFIFPALAFGTFMWWVVGGQIVAKIAGAIIWSLILLKRLP